MNGFVEQYANQGVDLPQSLFSDRQRQPVRAVFYSSAGSNGGGTSLLGRRSLSVAFPRHATVTERDRVSATETWSVLCVRVSTRPMGAGFLKFTLATQHRMSPITQPLGVK